ncbi:MAG: hypothetical protein KIS87_13485 [Phycisphaeraceae bacterium]|nr:hypothetical protein [Phycisphaeraceae bacterium]
MRDGDGFVAPSALNGEDGFLLPLHRSTEGGVLFLPEFERGGELMATRPRASRQRPRPERQLVTIAIDDARATERDAATAERELPTRRAGARRASRGIVLGAFAAELRALRFEHRGDGLHPELVDESEEVSADQRGERDEQLRPQRYWF